MTTKKCSGITNGTAASGSSSLLVYDVPYLQQSSPWSPLTSIGNLPPLLHTMAIDYYYSYAVLGGPDSLHLVDILNPASPALVDTLNTTVSAQSIGVSSDVHAIAAVRGDYCWAEGDASTQCSMACVPLSLAGKFGVPVLHAMGTAGSCSIAGVLMNDLLLLAVSRSGTVYSSLAATISVADSVAVTTGGAAVADLAFMAPYLLASVPGESAVKVVNVNDYQNMAVVPSNGVSSPALAQAGALQIAASADGSASALLVATTDGSALYSVGLNVTGMSTTMQNQLLAVYAAMDALSAPTISTQTDRKFVQFTAANTTAALTAQQLQILSTRSKTTFTFSVPAGNSYVKARVLSGSVWTDQPQFTQAQLNAGQVRLVWIGATDVTLNVTLTFAVTNGRGASTTAAMTVGMLGASGSTPPADTLMQQLLNFLRSLYTSMLGATIAVVLFVFSLLVFCVSYCCVRCRRKRDAGARYAQSDMETGINSNILKTRSQSNMVLKKSQHGLNQPMPPSQPQLMMSASMAGDSQSLNDARSARATEMDGVAAATYPPPASMSEPETPTSPQYF